MSGSLFLFFFTVTTDTEACRPSECDCCCDNTYPSPISSKLVRRQFFVKFLVTFLTVFVYRLTKPNATTFSFEKKKKKNWNWRAFVVIENSEEAFVGWEFEGTWGSLLKIPLKLLKLISNMPIPCMYYYILSLSLLLNLFLSYLYFMFMRSYWSWFIYLSF